MNWILGPEQHPEGGPMRAMWRGVVLAESDDTVVVEGNHYFPAGSVRREHLRPSSRHTVCPWKGQASYYDVVVEGAVTRDAAGYYPAPSEAAAQIKDRVAFWHGVEVAAAAGARPGPEARQH
jgi:uncharacterized protein (DUF427 family)